MTDQDTPRLHHELSRTYIRKGGHHTDTFRFAAPARIVGFHLAAGFTLESVSVGPHGSLGDNVKMFTGEDLTSEGLGALSEYTIVESDDVRINVHESAGLDRMFGGYVAFVAAAIVDDVPEAPGTVAATRTAHQQVIQSPGESAAIEQFLASNPPIEDTPMPRPRVNGNGNGQRVLAPIVHQAPFAPPYQTVPQHQQSMMGVVQTSPAPGVPAPGQPYYENHLPKAPDAPGTHPYEKLIPGYGGGMRAGGPNGAEPTQHFHTSPQLQPPPQMAAFGGTILQVPPNCVGVLFTLGDAQLLLRLASGDGGIAVQHLQNARNALQHALLGSPRA